ncbi:MAG: prolipoprotein diacylglyceryl transferase [Christensenellales bacterium]
MLSRPLLDRVAFLGISWYAVLIVGAMVIGYFLASNEARRLRLPQDTVIDFMLYAVPLGIICARLYYVAFRFNDYSDNLLSVFNIREGGLAIYGGVIGGLIAAKLVSRKHKISMLTLLDVVAPALVLGQGIGRWGNYINMEAYGLRIAEESLQFFPFAVEIPVGDVWYWHMATFFYEFCWDMLVFVLLMAIRKHRRRGGDVFCWYLLLYCSGRTVIEGLRNDSLTFISEFVRIRKSFRGGSARRGDLFLPAHPRPHQRVTVADGQRGAVHCRRVLGEFERGAYSFLFTFSQIGLAVLMISQIAIIAL